VVLSAWHAANFSAIAEPVDREDEDRGECAQDDNDDQAFDKCETGIVLPRSTALSKHDFSSDTAADQIAVSAVRFPTNWPATFNEKINRMPLTARGFRLLRVTRISIWKRDRTRTATTAGEWPTLRPVGRTVVGQTVSHSYDVSSVRPTMHG
jgi:hypothetical protein